MSKQEATPKAKAAPKTVEQPKVVSFKSENIINLQPKSLPFSAYHLKDLNPSSVEDLIKTLGREPKASFKDGKLQLSYGSKLPYLFADCVIKFDSLGNILWIDTFEKVSSVYTVLNEKK